MLTSYLLRTRQTLQNPPASTVLYSDSDLTTYINLARSQIAGESESIRNYASLALVQDQRQYAFSTITLGGPSIGIQGIFNIRQALMGVGAGNVWMRTRSFPWFLQYRLNQIVPIQNMPTEWSQFGQGVTGSIFVDPVPDQAYTMTLDTVCYPVTLVDDTTPEAIPYPWTDCVPFFAAYYALLSSQRIQDAEQMFQTYEKYMTRARSMSNPDVLAKNYSQSRDETLPNKLGLRPPTRGGQQ